MFLTNSKTAKIATNKTQSLHSHKRRFKMSTTENNRQKVFIVKGMISRGIILVLKSTKQENLLVKMKSVGSCGRSSVRCFS